MTIFLLNETDEVRKIGDMIAFKSLDDLSVYVEPIDIDGSAFSVFDTTGQFYQVRSTSDFDRFEFSLTDHDIDLVKRLIQDYLNTIGLGYVDNLDIETNARTLLARP